MKKSFIITIFCLMAPGIVFGNSQEQVDLAQPVKGIPGTISKDFGKVPLYFIANKGQTDERVSYFARTSKYTLWVTKTGLVFDRQGYAQDSVKKRDVSRFCFLNSNPNPRTSPIETTSYRVNYFKGRDRSQWKTRIPTSKAVLYEELYKNIDLKVYGIEKEVEYDWVVKPGGDPGAIRFRCEGVKSCTLDKKGDLIVRTAMGELIHKRPTGYQVKEGQKLPVQVTFSKPKGLKNTYGFKVGAYDKNYPLVIDPMVIVYTSYLGGNDADSISGLVVDGSGSVIVVGCTDSSNFPVLNGWQVTMAGYSDAFVTKFSPNGTSLVFSTFVGGSNGEVARSVGLDGSGCIYVGGGTGSTDFPTINAFQEENHSSECDEGFVFKLSANGSGMIYSSYLGGSGCEFVEDIAVNTSGELYAVGVTDSSDFPLQDPIQSTINGWNDLFITKLSASGTSLVYSTFLGGSDYDQSGGIAIDNSGCAYVTGMTAGVGFPTVNAFQPANAGGEDGYVTKISADGSSLVYSTYLGGNSGEWLYDVKVDNTGAAYVTGYSSSSNYPTTPNAFQPTLLGTSAAVITKLSPTGSSQVYSTFLEGSSGAGAETLCLYNGSVFISGGTSSYDFPLVDPFKDFFCYESGVFIAQLSPDGSTLDFSSFVSDSEYCSPADIEVDGSGNLYLAGYTSNNFPAFQGFQNTYGGGYYDGFVTKLVSSQYSRITVTSPNGGEDWHVGSTQTITWTAPEVMENVRIILYYYQNDEQHTITIAESAPNTGAYAWTVPNITSYDCTIIIEDPTSHVLPDWSDVNFTISIPVAITITSPNGGENWQIGTTQAITWTALHPTENVRIILYYYQDYEQYEVTIAASAPNTGTYIWTVPNVPSEQCIIYIEEVSSPIFSDFSDSSFTISPNFTPFIQLTSPNGGENWSVGTPHSITWIDSGTIPQVALDYSTDNGNTWTSIVSSISNTNSYNWTTPNTPSTNCLVRVSEVGGTLTDTSDAVFTLWVPTIPTAEREALISLYNSTNGDNWTNNTNWRKPGDPNQFNDPGTEWSWYGITVNMDSAHVEKISLWGKNLTGSLPDLSALTALWKLDLGNNHLSGSIPSHLNGLTSLKELWMQINNFTGPITDLSGLTQLEVLCLLSNSLTGTIPEWLNNLTALKTINLGENQLTGSIPILSNLLNLQYLSLSENQLTGEIPTWLNNITQLKSIDLGENQLSGSIPALNNLIQLESLSLDFNQLTGSIPDLSGSLNLKYLILSNNSSMTGTLPTWLNQLVKLEWINLYSCGLTGAIPSLNRLTKLRYFDLSNNQLTGSIPDLSASVLLEYLYLSNNQLTGTVPSWLNQCPYLIDISLFHNQLTGTLPNLSNLKELESLSLGYNQLSGIISQLGAITGIRNLILNHNNFSGSLPGTWLSSLANLNMLSLYDNQYSGTIPDLSSMGNLTYLNLSNNSLTGSIPSTIGNLTSLEGLYLEENQLTGPIPSELGNLSALKYLSLSSNQLTGSFPTSITTLSSLLSLFLDKNHLSGAIPTEMGNMTALFDFSLSGNQFMGEIPTSLLNLTNTTYRDISWNGLYTDNADLRNFLGLNGITTQTVPPTGLSTTSMNQNEIKVSWVPISYSSAGSGLYRVYYTTTPGSGYTLAGSTASITDDSYTITGLDSGTTYYFVVQTFTNANPYNENTLTSDYSEEVSGNAIDFRVISPNGGEVWEGGTHHEITWSDNNTDENATLILKYSTDGGANWLLIAGFLGQSPQHWDWLVPNQPSTNCLVKIFNSNNLSDTSDAVFTISAQRTITVTTPNGGENWEETTSQNITWTSTGSISNVKLEYSINNGSSWNTIIASTTNNGTYNWTVPNTPSTSCLVKVSDTAGPAADTSDAVFTIASQRTLTVTAPNGGENWEGTTSLNITWTSTGSIANVKLEYSINNGSSWNTIIASTTNNGTYNWTVPNTPSTSCLVKVSDTAGPAADTSDAVFTIAAQRTITVTAPNGGQRWFIDSTYAITWSSTGSISSVIIEYSTNSGSSWTGITSSSSNTGTYNWTIPNTPSSNCLVRVSDTSGPASDVSNSVFTIDPYPTITVTAPNGGETWIANTTHAITWAYTGTIAAVNLEYSSNNGSSWTSIASSVSNTGSYNWVIPYISSTNCLVRVSDNATTASDTGNAVFTLELPPSLTVTSPNGGETWKKRSIHTITWTWTGTVGNVKIQYTMNGGSSWTTITSSTANDGSHQWTLPNVTNNKTQCLVKITAINGSAVDTSDAFFTILK